MKRLFIAAISLSLLLSLAAWGQAASLSVNLIGKYEGTVQMARGLDYSTTSMVVRIVTQTGAIFIGTVSFLKNGVWDTTNFNGAIFEGGFRFTGNEVVGDGKYLPSSPPYLSGCFQSPAVTGDTRPASTGLFYLKRTSTNPAAP